MFKTSTGWIGVLQCGQHVYRHIKHMNGAERCHHERRHNDPVARVRWGSFQRHLVSCREPSYNLTPRPQVPFWHHSGPYQPEMA
jgi:hypothetical protein